MSPLAEKTTLLPAGASLDSRSFDGPAESLSSGPAEPGQFDPDLAPEASHDWSRHWAGIQAHLALRPRLLLALGFDGILSPTVTRPHEATLPEDTQALLSKFAASPRITLAFLSGRSLADLQRRVGLPNAYYAGNHGMELRGPAFSSSDGLAMSCRSDLVDALAFLAQCTRRLRGVYVEDKGMTVNVHWRLTSPSDAAALRELMEVIVRHHPRLKIFSGEACWELRARASWNKGDALRQILKHLGLASADTVYVGEQFTDEDAFVRVSDGLSFCVGHTGPAAARFRLADIADARSLLFCLLCAVNGVPLK